MKELKIFIIAGEASGDLYGAKLMNSLRDIYKGKINFYGIGGNRMNSEGLSSIFPMSEISIMGFLEIIPHIPNVLNRINQTVSEILKLRPDVVITIDSPGFNCRVVKKLQDSNIKLVHYVAPTVWAYKPKRAQKFAKLFDHLLLLLPFEPPYFDAVGLANTFVGHPIVETTIGNVNKAEFRKKHQIDNSDILLCLMPGSRSTELTKLLNIFLETALILKAKHKNLKIIIPTLPPLAKQIKYAADYLDLDTIVVDNEDEKYAAYQASDIALVKSGTASLEVALSGCPMIIAYKINHISYLILKRMIKIKYANLINLILDKELIPELLQEKCFPKNLAESLEKLINSKDLRSKQIAESTAVFKQLGKDESSTPSEKASKKILKIICQA